MEECVFNESYPLFYLNQFTRGSTSKSRVETSTWCEALRTERVRVVNSQEGSTKFSPRKWVGDACSVHAAEGFSKRNCLVFFLSLGCDTGHFGSAVRDTAWQSLAGQPAGWSLTAVFCRSVGLWGSQTLSYRAAKKEIATVYKASTTFNSKHCRKVWYARKLTEYTWRVGFTDSNTVIAERWSIDPRTHSSSYFVVESSYTRRRLAETAEEMAKAFGQHAVGDYNYAGGSLLYVLGRD